MSVATGSLPARLAFLPPGREAAPLLVFLHGWTQDYRNDLARQGATWCQRKGWAFLAPGMGGPFYQGPGINTTPMLDEILATIVFATARGGIDTSRIFLVGVSAGASVALYLADSHPERFRAVSAWVPITNLPEWHNQLTGTTWRYRRDLENQFLVNNDSAAFQAKLGELSPLFKVNHANGAALDLHAGILDGKTGPVPISHSLQYFDRVCAERTGRPRKISDSVAVRLLDGDPPPSPVPIDDLRPAHGLWRDSCGNARLTVFQGGHQIYLEPTLRWLETWK